MPRFGRNETEGLAERTWTNFLLIERTFTENDEGHVVTQLVCSLLGLVVFPWERRVLDHANSERLEKLIGEGWPQWEFVEGGCQTLGDLIRNLRHGVAHSNVWFSAESRHSSVSSLMLSHKETPARRPGLVRRMPAAAGSVHGAAGGQQQRNADQRCHQ